MKKLSIGMIVKNEADKLEATLQALRPLRDAVPCELIIADTGSTDETLAIAKEYGDKVFSLEWENDFAKARNATLVKATGEWFFFLDADEILREHQELAKFLLMPQSKQYQTIMVPIYNITSEKENNWNMFWVGRIFRRSPGVFFKGKIHEQPTAMAPFFTLRTTNLYHTGYDNENLDLMAKKSARNLATIEEILQESNTPMEKAKAYLDGADACFLYSTPENIQKGITMIHDAIEIIKQWQLTKKERKFYLARAYSLLVKKQLNQQNWFACRDFCQEYFDIQPDRGSHDMDICFAQSIAEYNLGNYAVAKVSGEAYLRCTEQDIAEASRIFVILTISKKSEILFMVSDCYKRLGDNENAWQYAMQIEKKEVFGRSTADYQFSLAISQNMQNRLPVFYTSTPSYQTQLLIDLQKAALKSNGEQRLEFQETLRNFPQNSMVQQTLLCCTDDREEFLILLGQEKNVLEEKLGVIIDQWMRFNIPSEEILDKIDITKLNQFLFSCSVYTEPQIFAAHVVAYYRNQMPQNLDMKSLQAARYILGYNLFQEKISDATVIALWELLAQFGTDYIKRLYRPEIWQEAMLYLFNGLDRFIFYSQQALHCKEQQDYTQYAKLLRCAVTAYPQAKTVVEVLVKDIEDKVAPVEAKTQELNQLAEVVKMQIRQLIQMGNIEEAKSLLKQLAEIMPDEPELPTLSVLLEQPNAYLQ